MQLVDLAHELRLHVAPFLPQVDLHNACAMYPSRSFTESTSISILTDHRGQRTIKQFVVRLLDRPDLAKCVHRIELKPYSHLSDLNLARGPDAIERRAKCTPEEYERLTQAAVDAGVITDVLPYKAESSI
jgi:hypothetical protein